MFDKQKSVKERKCSHIPLWLSTPALKLDLITFLLDLPKKNIFQEDHVLFLFIHVKKS